MLTGHSGVSSFLRTASQYKLPGVHSREMFGGFKTQACIRSGDDDGLPSKVGRRKRGRIGALIPSEIAETFLHAEEDSRDPDVQRVFLVLGFQ